MSSCSSNSLAPWRRSQSQIRRGVSGSDARRRSLRGGKSPPGTSPAGSLRTLLVLLPDQEAVGQHHRHRVAVEAGPQATLILIPAQQPLGLLMVLFHPVPTVPVFDQCFQPCPRPEVTPVILALRFRVAPRLLPDQPARPTPAIGPHPPAAQRHEPAVQPALAPLTPADRTPRRRWLRCHHGVHSLSRAATPAPRHGEVTTNRDHIALAPFFQTSQEVRIVAIV